jgi:hypothetical protein
MKIEWEPNSASSRQVLLVVLIAFLIVEGNIDQEVLRILLQALQAIASPVQVVLPGS